MTACFVAAASEIIQRLDSRLHIDFSQTFCDHIKRQNMLQEKVDQMSQLSPLSSQSVVNSLKVVYFIWI